MVREAIHQGIQEISQIGVSTRTPEPALKFIEDIWKVKKVISFLNHDM